MIIRSAFTCDTCGKLHVVRIGMGQEEHQSHRFPCRACGEDIGVGLNVDYVNVTARAVPEHNCTLAQEEQGAEIVNLDANFLIPAEERGLDRVFPRIQQMHALVKRAIEAGAKPSEVDLAEPKLNQRPHRRPDYNAEWIELRRAWTLHRRDQAALSRGVIKKVSTQLYPDEPLDGLPDWLFRLCLHLSSPHYYHVLEQIIERIRPVFGTPAFGRFIDYYSRAMAPVRGRKYLSIMTEYFSAYSEFAQVHLLVVNAVHLIASGLVGEPTAPVIGIAGATNMNS